MLKMNSFHKNKKKDRVDKMKIEEQAEKESTLLAKSWAQIENSRHPLRPHALDYISALFSDFEEVRGDRHFANDDALIAGMGALKDPNSPMKNVFFLANQKGRTTKQKIHRNFAMAKPEGYRKAIRLMELAERFHRPIIAFIDTPGAFPGIEAEERGQSEAIARSIQRMFEVNVPTLGFVIGEGGSGGALAIGVVDKLFMLSNSTYSVISPESCAAILWGQASEAKRAARALRMTAESTFSLGICEGIIEEPHPGAHEHFDVVCHSMNAKISECFTELGSYSVEQLKLNRAKKFRHIDHQAGSFEDLSKGT
jgi:acetyl-CoA carboxylase carboxyl transferase subunit alpha